MPRHRFGQWEIGVYAKDGLWNGFFGSKNPRISVAKRFQGPMGPRLFQGNLGLRVGTPDEGQQGNLGWWNVTVYHLASFFGFWMCSKISTTLRIVHATSQVLLFWNISERVCHVCLTFAWHLSMGASQKSIVTIPTCWPGNFRKKMSSPPKRIESPIPNCFWKLPGSVTLVAMLVAAASFV